MYSMDHRQRLESFVARLAAAPGGTVERIEIGSPVGDAELQVVGDATGLTPSPALLAVYRQMDGAILTWTWNEPGQPPLAGGLKMSRLLAAFLRAGAGEEDEPLEGVLWNADAPAKALAQLKTLSILDSSPGRGEFITFRGEDDPPQLFLVEDEEVAPLVPDLDETLEALWRHGGCDDLRPHLKHPDWRARIAADPGLTRLAALTS
ncbi:hypothetical protein BH10PSE4_BH10PSE4_13220 [soil metagenome]